MSLNNWLCKYFDDENKGYVTIGDVISVIIQIGLGLLLLVSLVIVMIYYIGGFFASIVVPNYSGDAFMAFIYFGYFILVVMILFIFIYFIYLISEIKIAKCPLKEKKE